MSSSFNCPSSAGTNDGLHVLQVSRADIEKWLREREITPSEMGAILERLDSPVDLFSKAGQPEDLPLRAHAQPLARPRIVVTTAVSNLTILDFDQLFKLGAVLTAQAHPLLQTFLSGGPDNLCAWQQAHSDTTEEFAFHPSRPLPNSFLFCLPGERPRIDAANKERICAGLLPAELAQTLRAYPHLWIAGVPDVVAFSWNSNEKVTAAGGEAI
ncbi:hypothetical protein EDB85DRAFT_2146417 [Lactarius pseudohatsudake]|nr:hypothetical protein EDB85DRAFT_2146417 [Lactarius pseudohatsudake]